MGRKTKSRPATVTEEDTLLAAAMQQAPCERERAARAVAESPPGETPGRYGEKKFVLACDEGKLVVMREMLGQGVNPDFRTYRGETDDQRGVPEMSSSFSRSLLGWATISVEVCRRATAMATAPSTNPRA